MNDTEKVERDTTLNIFQRLMKATAEINRVAKNLKVDISKNQSYKAVAEADVLEAVKPVEEKFGIYSYPMKRAIVKDDSYITKTSYNGNESEKTNFFLRLEVTYRFVNVDKPDEFVDITTYGDGVDTQDKAPGKAMTYADKYALLKAYKIQTGDDPDANPSGSLGRKKEETVVYASQQQLKAAEEAGINLLRLADYCKRGSVSELTADDVEKAITIKKNAVDRKVGARGGSNG